MKKPIVFFVGIASLLVCLANSCTEAEVPQTEKTSESSSEGKYLGSGNCATCHKKEYEEWLQSDHYLAMQNVSDSSVLGDFRNVQFASDGIKSRFSKQGKQFLIHTQGPDGSNRDFEVSYVFGYFPLQQYLIALPGGRFQATRQSWNSRDKKWFHQYPGQTIPPSDWLHWTGNSQNWNTMCASCHSTNYKKNYNFETDSYASTFSEINVACESCHGSGEKHLSYVQSEAYKNREPLAQAGLLYGKDKHNQRQLNSCAPCHARKSDISESAVSGSELLDRLIPELISNEHYFADGQIKDEDYEYGSFAQSKMFHKGIKCSDCHNPHSGRLKKQGNAMCLSCHESKYDSESHHFHQGAGESTKCINCHMPEKTYMGNDHRRDHSFRIPRPDQSMVYSTPNTCNACHNKQTAKWAAEAIVKWYGPKRDYHFSDDLLPGSLLNADSKSHLLKLAGDTSQAEIARASALYYLSNLQDEETAEVLLQHSRDEKPLVRYHAFRALENFPTVLWAHAATHGLSDQVRAVRIAAADLYHLAGEQLVPAVAKNAYAAANAENKAYLQYQRDFAIGNVMMGDYHLQETDYKGAIVHYLRGLKKDSLMNYARLNLSAAYNGLKLNNDALNTLKQAEKIDPNNTDVQHNLALLYYESGEPESSLVHFKKALATGKAGPDVYYNYGLLLQQSGSAAEAEHILLKGYTSFPVSGKLNYALSYLYLKNHNLSQARKYAYYLFKTEPNNTAYQALFKQLGLVK